MPDAPDWVTLTADEQIVWIGHPSRYLAARSVIGGVALAALGVALAALAPELSWVPLVLVLVGALILAAGILARRSTTYVVTTAEVYRKRGLLSRSVTNLRHDRVQNTSFTQSFLQRLLDYGDVRIDTAGSGRTELVLEGVSAPARINGILTEQLDRDRRGGGRRSGGAANYRRP